MLIQNGALLNWVYIIEFACTGAYDASSYKYLKGLRPRVLDEGR